MREHFKIEDFLNVRKKTIVLVEEIVSKLDVGMGETEIVELVETKFRANGIEKKWHPVKFRIGQDTLRSFSEKSVHNQKLETGEIFFIDIGPVWDGYEGDFGKTFVFGEDLNGYQKLADTAEDVFRKTADHWRNESVGGVKLYEFASEYAKKLGLELNTAMDGHRLGDFPHHLFYRGGLAETEEIPVDNLWVLEILIKDPKLERGAFFEDILSRI